MRAMKAHAGERHDSLKLNLWHQMEVRGQLRVSTAVSLGREPPLPFEHEAG